MTNIENIDALAQEILNTCGGTRFLHIESGNGKLVQALLSNGVNAYGIDKSFKSIAIMNSIMPGRFTQGNMEKLPYADKTFDTIVVLYSLEHVKREKLIQVIKELKRVTRRSLYLRAKTVFMKESNTNKNVFNRYTLENLFFSENFRKHPSYYLVNDYNTLGHSNNDIVILLECISRTASKRYPLKILKQDRDLHMDMTRETGERSDAHIVRYQWASTFVRPGDTVLDAACGLGYGSYILQCSTMAAKTIGIDRSNYAIDYANINFAPDVANLTFSSGLLSTQLNDIHDNSVDVVVSFETLEHILDPESVLKEFHRILTPAGRVIISVPNDWSDETNKDPNPFHLHIYTLDKLRDQLKSLFDLENITVQSATHYKKTFGSKHWVPAQRELYEIDINIDETAAPPSEWWLAVGMKSPLNSEGVTYHETQYKTFPQSEWNVTAFARDYKNPWLIRGMVDIGWRQKNTTLLSKLIEKVININSDNNADVGAALCVKGYQLLNVQQTVSIDVLNRYVKRVNKYMSRKSVTPHVIRWMISLHFVTAKLWLRAGMHNKAYDSFIKCIEIDPLQFSPLLANKTVEAYLYLGKLALNDGNKASAQRAWIAGITSAQRAVTANWNLSLGDLNDPAEFALPELSSILDCASNCAYALINIDHFKDKPWWWIQLQRSPHAQFASQKIQFNSLKTQILLLNTFISSLHEDIKNQKNQLLKQAHNIQTKERELEELKNTLNFKDMVIAKQAVKIHELDTIKKACLVSFQSLDVRKAIYVTYLIIALITPDTLRNRLKLISRWLRNNFSKYCLHVAGTNNVPISSGYQVKKPISKHGAPKVVHIIANFMTGGSSRLVVDLVEHLGCDYEQFVLTSYTPNPPAYIGIDIEEQRDSHNMSLFINYLKRKRPNFIHVYYWGDVDELWYIQAIEAAKILNIPVVENINTPTKPYISDIIQRYIYVSDYVRNVFGQHDVRHITIYPGSDFSHFTRAENEIVPSNCVGMVYRLEYDKLNKDSIKPFILIAQKRHKTKILIVGGGSLLSFFQKEVKNAGVESQFEFSGYVEYSTLPNYYRRMSLFIAPVWRESFGQVSLFAMNMRIPVIGYDIGAISEIVNSKNILALAGDAENLANIAITLLNDDKLRENIGREHQKRAAQNFSVQAMVKAYARVYSEIIKN